MSGNPLIQQIGRVITTQGVISHGKTLPGVRSRSRDLSSHGGVDVFYNDADVVHTLDRHDISLAALGSVFLALTSGASALSSKTTSSTSSPRALAKPRS